ncbi:MAG: hypothetical protein V8S34_06465 [Lawsonibacter sp.]
MAIRPRRRTALMSMAWRARASASWGMQPPLLSSSPMFTSSRIS